MTGSTSPPRKEQSITTTTWSKWGSRPYQCLPQTSEASKEYAASLTLDSQDVVVLTFSKTGTTLLQAICHQIINNGQGYDDIETEIAQVQPWLDFIYDAGQHQEEEILTHKPNNGVPRIFKSHQRPSAINVGAKYLSTVRHPEAAIQSWFDFAQRLKLKPYMDLRDANDLIARKPELYTQECHFGANIWSYYVELWEIRNEPNVLICCYEDLVAYKSMYIPLIQKFITCNCNDEKENNNNNIMKDDDLTRRVLHWTSRSIMLDHVKKFNENFYHERLNTKFPKANKVGPVRRGRTHLRQVSKEWMNGQWKQYVTPFTGHATYEEYCADICALVRTKIATTLPPKVVDTISLTHCHLDSVRRVQRRRSSNFEVELQATLQRRIIEP